MRPVFESIIDGRTKTLFMDPFAGSGSVSRLARSLGMAVRANDWEPYSESINRCWLERAPKDLATAFAGEGGIAAFLGDWNHLHPLAMPAKQSESRYMSRWYAPASTDQPEPLDRGSDERLLRKAGIPEVAALPDLPIVPGRVLPLPWLDCSML